MQNNANNTQQDLRTRLIVFLVVLAVGFVMGWFNGQGSETSGGPAEEPVAQEEQAPDDEQATQSQPDKSTVAPESERIEDSDDDSSTQAEPSQETDDSGESTVAPTRGPTVEKDGWYTSKEEVALYIHTYGRLPGNFISKTKARDKGWVASEGNLDVVCPGMSIGGSRYYNDDGQLPDKRGRQWTECDINYHGGYRGSERIVFSNDGLIYYTADHYETFERLY